MNYVVIVRGKLKGADAQESRKVHDATLEMLGDTGKSMGNIGHRAYLNAENPHEFLAIDTWDNSDGPQKLMQDPKLAEEFGKLFDGQPDVSMYAQTEWTGW